MANGISEAEADCAVRPRLRLSQPLLFCFAFPESPGAGGRYEVFYASLAFEVHDSRLIRIDSRATGQCWASGNAHRLTVPDSVHYE